MIFFDLQPIFLCEFNVHKKICFLLILFLLDKSLILNPAGFDGDKEIKNRSLSFKVGKFLIVPFIKNFLHRHDKTSQKRHVFGNDLGYTLHVREVGKFFFIIRVQTVRQRYFYHKPLPNINNPVSSNCNTPVRIRKQ